MYLELVRLEAFKIRREIVGKGHRGLVIIQHSVCSGDS